MAFKRIRTAKELSPCFMARFRMRVLLNLRQRTNQLSAFRKTIRIMLMNHKIRIPAYQLALCIIAGCAQAAGNASLNTRLPFHSMRPRDCGLPSRSQVPAS